MYCSGSWLKALKLSKTGLVILEVVFELFWHFARLGRGLTKDYVDREAFRVFKAYHIAAAWSITQFLNRTGSR